MPNFSNVFASVEAVLGGEAVAVQGGEGEAVRVAVVEAVLGDEVEAEVHDMILLWFACLFSQRDRAEAEADVV